MLARLFVVLIILSSCFLTIRYAKGILKILGSVDKMMKKVS